MKDKDTTFLPSPSESVLGNQMEEILTLTLWHENKSLREKISQCVQFYKSEMFPRPWASLSGQSKIDFEVGCQVTQQISVKFVQKAPTVQKHIFLYSVIKILEKWIKIIPSKPLITYITKNLDNQTLYYM